MEKNSITPGYLTICIGKTKEEQQTRLQSIKDAIVSLLFNKIEREGIEETDIHFRELETIYLEADHKLHQLNSPQA